MKLDIRGGRNIWFLIIATGFLLYIPSAVLGGEPGLRVVTDMAGRKVLLKGPVNSIVTTFKPASLCIHSLGLSHKLGGVDTHSRGDRLQQAVFPQVQNLTGVGSKSTGINVETVVSLDPDLVILYAQKDGLAIAGRLDAMNIPSVVILPESFSGIKASLSVISAAVGESDRIVVSERAMDRVLDLTADRLAGLTEETRKRGYFASVRGIFSTATGNMLQDEIFKKAGIVNVADGLTGYFQDISPEQLVQWNPDIMVLSRIMKSSQEKRLSDRALQTITAISQKAVYRCPSSLSPWDFPSPLSVLAVLWVAKKAYPDWFLDIDIKMVAEKFHRDLFGKTLTEMGGVLGDRALMNP